MHHKGPGRRVRLAEAESRALAEAPHRAVLTRRECVRATDRRRRHLDTAQRPHPLRRLLRRSDPVAEIEAV